MNNLKTVLLLVLAVFIWGFAAYKILTYGKNDKDPIRQLNDKSKVVVDDTEIDYQLMLNYRDPFEQKVRKYQGKSKVSKQTPSPKAYTRSRGKKEAEPITNSDKHEIYYQGLIEVPGENVTGVINISGIEYIAAANDTISNYLVVNIDEFAVVLYDFLNEMQYEYKR